MTATNLSQLEERIREQIPLTQHLGFRLEQRVAARLTLAATLDGNSNDKGTMFAGSITSLCTLVGWALTTLLAEEAGVQADVLAVKNAIRYQLPIQSDARFTTSVDEDALASFDERLTRRGKARLPVQVEVWAAGECCASFEGDYLARSDG